MTRAERIIHDRPWCSAGDEPLAGSEHAAAWEVVHEDRFKQELVDEAIREGA
jgi:hypothetical protein